MNDRLSRSGGLVPTALSLLALGLSLAVVVTGCGSREDPQAPPEAPVPHEHQPVPPPSLTPLPPGEAPATPQPDAPRTTGKPSLPPLKLAEVPSRYQSLMNQPAERSALIADVAMRSDVDAAPAEVARTLGKLLAIETANDLREEIIEELGDLETAAALDPLLSALQPGQPPEIQEAAADAIDTLLTDLAYEEEPGAYDKIAKVTGNQYPKAVRLSAIDALEFLEDQRAVSLLQGMISDPDAEIRKAAEDAIHWLQAK